jgi:hypothetical protein
MRYSRVIDWDYCSVIGCISKISRYVFGRRTVVDIRIEDGFMKNNPRDQSINGNIPQPIRSDGAGFVDLGPRDVMRDMENPDLLVPPPTDAGTTT